MYSFVWYSYHYLTKLNDKNITRYICCHYFNLLTALNFFIHIPHAPWALHTPDWEKCHKHADGGKKRSSLNRPVFLHYRSSSLIILCLQVSGSLQQARGLSERRHEKSYCFLSMHKPRELNPAYARITAWKSENPHKKQRKENKECAIRKKGVIL